MHPGKVMIDQELGGDKLPPIEENNILGLSSKLQKNSGPSCTSASGSVYNLFGKRAFSFKTSPILFFPNDPNVRKEGRAP